MKSAKILSIAMFVVAVSGIATDMYAPSLPAISQYFNVHSSLAKFTMVNFLIGFGLGQILFGTASDIYGRKNTLFTSLSTFLIASVIAIMAQNIYILMLARLLQGIGAGGPSAIAKSLCSDSFSDVDLQKSMSYQSITWGLGLILSPAIGGYFQHYFGWQSIFYFMIAYALASSLIVLIKLPETIKQKLEFKPNAILTSYKDVLGHKKFIGVSVCVGITYGCLLLFNIIGPFLIQTQLHYSAIVFGHMALLISIFYVIGALTSRFLARRVLTHKILRYCYSLLLITTIINLIINSYFPLGLYPLIAPLFVIVLIIGITTSNAKKFGLSLFPHRGGVASALMGAILVLSAATVSIIGSLIHSHTAMPLAWLYFGLSVINLLIYFKIVA